MPLPQPRGEEDASPQVDSSLQGESWFHGNLSRKEAEKLLKEDGDFLVRFASNYSWVYVLSCKTEKEHQHFKLLLNNLSCYHTNGGNFRSIRHLIQVHQSEGKPVSKDPSTIIRRAVKTTIRENSLPEEDASQGNDNEISKDEEDVNSEDQVSTIQESCESNTSVEENFADNHLEVPHVSDHPEIPPRTAHMKEFYPDLERTSTKQDPDSQRGEETNFEKENLREDGEDCVEDHSVKSLVKAFNCHESRVPSTETEKNNSKDGPHENRFNNDPKYIREVKEVKEEVEVVKSLMQSLLEKGIQPDSITQDTTYTDTVVEFDEELFEVDLSPEEREDAQSKKENLQLYWHMEINDQLRDIVAQYLEPEFFHDVGKKLGVHRNRRIQIELEKSNFIERTYELLGQWHQKHGHMATIGKLIECLEPFDPEDFTTMLEKLCEELGDDYNKFT